MKDYEETSWDKTDDEVIWDYHDDVYRRDEIGQELKQRGYVQDESREWIHQSKVDDDDVEFGFGVGGIAIVGIIILAASFFVTVGVHFVLQYLYLYSTPSFVIFGVMLVLLILTKANDLIKFLYALATIAAIAASYPVLITLHENTPNYHSYLAGDTGYFPLVFYAIGFFVYLIFGSLILYKLSVATVQLFQES